MKSLALTLIPLSLIGCVSLEDDSTIDEQDSTATQYVDIFDFNGIDQGAWYDSTNKLNASFVQMCKDSGGCGDYPDLTPLTFRCAVTSKIGNIHDCAWTFAGSQSAVDPTSAAIALDAPTFQCHSKPLTNAKKLAAFLQSSTNPLTDTLPGGGTLGDGLADCFTHPLDSTPITIESDPAGVYVAATDYYHTGANQTRWQQTIAALKLGFDNICGDTFCGGDMGDLQSLDLTCAITKSTGNVKSCAWVFGGSLLEVGKGGAESATSKTFRCNLAMHATISQLMDLLVAAGPSAIDTPLPGTTGTAYDALGGCLP